MRKKKLPISTEAELMNISFNAFFPILAQIEDTPQRQKLFGRMASVMFDTLEIARQKDYGDKNTWVNVCYKLFEKERLKNKEMALFD